MNGACDNIFSSAIPPEHQEHVAQYTTQLTAHITGVAAAALDSMQKSRLDWAVGKVTFAKNRRLVNGPVDHDLPMLVVRDAQTGRPRAIYVSYACHATTLSFNRINGDWPGYAAAMIERLVQDSVALVSIGAGSDQKPESGVVNDHVEIAEAQGVQIAAEVRRLLDGPPATGVRFRERSLESDCSAAEQTPVARTACGTNRQGTADRSLQRADTGLTDWIAESHCCLKSITRFRRGRLVTVCA